MPLGITEITNEKSINDFLGLDTPAPILESTGNSQTVKTPVDTKKTEKTETGKEFVIDEAALFAGDIVPIEETKKDPEVENTTETDKAPDTTKTTPTTDDETEIFSKLGEGLSKLGVLTAPEDNKDFKWNRDSFIERLETAKIEGAQSILSDIITEVENGEELFKALFIDKLPVTDYAKFSNAIVDYSTMDLKSEANQETIVRKFLQDLGQDDEDVDSTIEYLKDTDKLKDTAVKYKDKLVEKTERERQNALAEAQAKEQAKEIQKKQFLSSVSSELSKAVQAKEIDGIPFSLKEAKELLEYATKPVYEHTQTKEKLSEFDKALLEVKKDPKQYIKLVKLIKNGLNIKSAVEKKASEITKDVFDFFGKKATPTATKDPFLDLFNKQK